MRFTIHIRNTVAGLLCTAGALYGQGPFDGYLKGKGNLDIAPSFSSNTFDQFQGADQQRYDLSYRGYLLSIFAEYGLTKNLDLIGTGAYIFTPLKDGLQDGGLFVKYRFLRRQIAGNFNLHLLAGSGLAFPLSDYEPTANGALGVKAITLPARLIVQLETPVGLFINITGGYNWRLDRASKGDVAAVRISRPDFEAQAPANYTSLLLKVGFPAAHYYLDAWYEWQYTPGGTDYLPGVVDLPQLYGVSYNQIGGTAYYSESGKMGFHISSAYIFSGRNVGEIFRLTGGVVVKLNFIKKQINVE